MEMRLNIKSAKNGIIVKQGNDTLVFTHSQDLVAMLKGAFTLDGETPNRYFNVVLVGYKENAQIPVIKQVRALTGLGLREAKDLTDTAKGYGKANVLENVSKQDGEAVIKSLEAAGGIVRLLPVD